MQSADDVFKLTTSTQLGQQTGRFFAGRGPVQMSAIAKNASARQRLWKIMTEQTNAYTVSERASYCATLVQVALFHPFTGCVMQP